ncbi:MAG: hypothetical protein WC641_06455 [Patescibacteria group bacterium]
MHSRLQREAIYDSKRIELHFHYERDLKLFKLTVKFFGPGRGHEVRCLQVAWNQKGGSVSVSSDF